MNNTAILAEQKDFMRVLHIGKVALTFYQVQRVTPSEQDYSQWLNQLPIPERALYQNLGFYAGKSMPDFKRFCRSLLNAEMVAYMRQNLSAEDFELWQLKRHTPTQA